MAKALFFLFFFSISNATVQSQNLNSLDVNLFFEEDTMQLIDPWKFKLEISNNGASEARIYPVSIYGGRRSEIGFISLEIKQDSAADWIRTPCIINTHSENGYPATNPSFGLQPKETFRSVDFHCPSPTNLLRLGILYARIVYAPYGIGDTTRIYSPPLKLTITPYRGVDLSAYNYLKKLLNPNFILYPLVEVSHVDTSDIVHAEYLVKNFPESSLSDYARLYLTSMYLSKAYNVVKGSKNVEDGLYYLRLSKKYGLSVIEKNEKKMREIAIEKLKSLEGISAQLYNYYSPSEIVEEFTFPFKH
ncbi:MAG: hypothetical protein JNN28_21585 [Saprospiraceae bacterium]|nr:hypothetical protein [Saprospiraceae bacterium]